MKLLIIAVVMGLAMGVAGAASLPPECYGPPNEPNVPPPRCGLGPRVVPESYTPKVLWYRPSTKWSGAPARKKQH
jgi:hypothetical protein